MVSFRNRKNQVLFAVSQASSESVQTTVMLTTELACLKILWLCELKVLVIIIQKDNVVITEGLSLPSCTQTYIFDYELHCKMHWQEPVSHDLTICKKMLLITRRFINLEFLQPGGVGLFIYSEGPAMYFGSGSYPRRFMSQHVKLFHPFSIFPRIQTFSEKRNLLCSVDRVSKLFEVVSAQCVQQVQHILKIVVFVH